MTQPRKVSTREELQNLKRADLQKLAKDHNIKANLKTDALIEELIQIVAKPSRPKALPPRRGKVPANREEQENEPISKAGQARVRPVPTTTTGVPGTRTRKPKDDQVELGVGRPKITSVTAIRKPSSTAKSSVIPPGVIAANPVKPTNSSMAKTKPKTSIPKRTGIRVPTSIIAKAARTKPVIEPKREGEQTRPSLPTGKSLELVASTSTSQIPSSSSEMELVKPVTTSVTSEKSLVRRESSPSASDVLRKMSTMQEELTDVRLELDSLRQEVKELRKENNELRDRVRSNGDETGLLDALQQRLLSLEKQLKSKSRAWSASSSDGEIGLPPITVARSHLQTTSDPYTPPAQIGTSVPPRSRTPQALAPAVDILPGSGSRERWHARTGSSTIAPTTTAFLRSASQTSVQADDSESHPPIASRSKVSATYIPPGIKSNKKRIRESVESPTVGPSTESQTLEVQQDAHKAKRRKLQSGASHPPTADEAEHRLRANQEPTDGIPPKFFTMALPQMSTPPSMPRYHPALEAPGSPSPTRGAHGRVSNLLAGLPLPPPRRAGSATPFERNEIHKDSLPITALPFPLIPSPARASATAMFSGSARKRASSETREDIPAFPSGPTSTGSGSNMARKESVKSHPYRRPESRKTSVEPIQSTLAPPAPVSSNGSTSSTALKSPLQAPGSLPSVPDDEILDLTKLDAEYKLGGFRPGAFMRQDPSSAANTTARVGDSPEFFITPGMRRGGGINGTIEETPPASKTLFGTEIGTVMRTKFSDPL